MRNFRLLNPDEIECRISQISEKGLSILLYKTARTDYALLDEFYGIFGWQNDYKLIDGKMYCGIAIQNPDTHEWIWKWNVGTESNTEGEKGQASDAMKRAGFTLGIGTELYSAPFIWIPADKCRITTGKSGKPVCYDKFSVSLIQYNEVQDICSLIISNQRGEQVFEWKVGNKPVEAPPIPKAQPQAQPTKQQTQPQAQPQQAQSGALSCADCGAEITEKISQYSTKYYGRPLCYACQKKQKK